MNTANNMKIRRKDVWRRSMALLLCLCSILSLFSTFGSTAAEAAGAEPAQNTAVTESAPASEESVSEPEEEPADEPAPAEDLPVYHVTDTTSGNSTTYATPDGTGATWTNSSRVYLWWKTNGTFGGITQQNTIHVYAKAGETICFGSNVYNSQLNINGTATESVAAQKGKNDIIMTDLHGERKAFDVENTGEKKGYIPNWQTEKAIKLAMNTKDGVKFEYSGSQTNIDKNKTYTYTPLTYKVKETGVYSFQFHSYGGGGNGNCQKCPLKESGIVTVVNKDTSTTTYNVFEPSQVNGLVTAWDLRVFDEKGELQTGRTYADVLALEMCPSGDTEMTETYYVVSPDSYIYELQFKGASPYTYNFFANNQGLIDDGTGVSVRRKSPFRVRRKSPILVNRKSPLTI